MEQIQDKRRLFEIIAAIVTGLGKIVLVDFLGLKLIYIVTAILFWVAYLLIRYVNNSDILRYWGFTTNNFKQSFKKLLPFVLLSVALFAGYGVIFDTMIINWHILPIMLIYPIWGVIQQYLVVGLIAGNLNDLEKYKFSKVSIIVATATLFSIVHYPSITLIVGTFLLAIIYTIAYLKERNLWVLGLFHGWLGCFFYYFVLSRDPFVEVFDKL